MLNPRRQSSQQKEFIRLRDIARQQCLDTSGDPWKKQLDKDGHFDCDKNKGWGWIPPSLSDTAIESLEDQFSKLSKKAFPSMIKFLFKLLREKGEQIKELVEVAGINYQRESAFVQSLHEQLSESDNDLTSADIETDERCSRFNTFLQNVQEALAAESDRLLFQTLYFDDRALCFKWFDEIRNHTRKPPGKRRKPLTKFDQIEGDEPDEVAGVAYHSSASDGSRSGSDDSDSSQQEDRDFEGNGETDEQQETAVAVSSTKRRGSTGNMPATSTSSSSSSYNPVYDRILLPSQEVRRVSNRESKPFVQTIYNVPATSRVSKANR